MKWSVTQDVVPQSVVVRQISHYRTKGWRMPPNTVYVGRGTKYGNPYRVGDDGIPNAETAKWKYLLFLAGGGRYSVMRERVGDVGKLRGKNLACWCAPGEPCHADMLLEIANQTQSAGGPR